MPTSLQMDLKNNASYEVKTKWFLFEFRISAEKVTHEVNASSDERQFLLHTSAKFL